MFPEIVKLKIEDEINSFERMTFERLFNSLDSIEPEAADKRKVFLDSKTKSFNLDTDDEACIKEEAYFKEINHIFIEQGILNVTATWLFY